MHTGATCVVELEVAKRARCPGHIMLVQCAIYNQQRLSLQKSIRRGPGRAGTRCRRGAAHTLFETSYKFEQRSREQRFTALLLHHKAQPIGGMQLDPTLLDSEQLESIMNMS